MQKNLVVQLARFGDILQSRRLIKSLLLQGEVVLCVDKTQENVARLAYPDLEIIPLDAFKIEKNEVLQKTKKTFDYIKNQKFNSLYTLNHTGLSYALSTLFEPEQVRGYLIKQGQRVRSEWVRLAFKYMQHRVQSPLHLIDYWGFLADEPIKPNEVNPSAYKGMLHWQKSEGAYSVAVILSGQNVRRSVPVDSLAQIVKIFARRFEKVEFILLGTDKEQALAQKLMSQLPQSVSDLIKNKTGKTNMEDLFSIIKNSSLVLSPDTGALHCAAFFGIPTLSFFCSSAWCFETGAYGDGHQCIQTTTQCAPCVESAPCANVHCHNVFSSPSLLARLSLANTKKEIENYSILESVFDEIGLNYVQREGVLPSRKMATQLRSLLYEYRYNKVIASHSLEIEELASSLFDNISCFFPLNKP